MSLVVLDTHVVYWWSSDSGRLSRTAARALERASQLVVASISWYELAWLAQHGRITVATPLRSWLEGLAGQIQTIATTPAIAATAAALPNSFTSDPTDRIIYATAVELGCQIVTKDQRMREHLYPRKIAVW